ncbi:CRISPR-associated ring nuclease Csm6 [Vibrio metschnikovii]|uniref:CRISPR-associated ring nuclease Csm6 n=1 Tax=Vibrio metschnikovii TaxID=28172 RepID=UPI001C2FDD62|nr:CRISPR-associated ring nuclease Csm6 [Vibrio metschnikovii]
MSQPEKTLLLAVTGATPQVITETLYAIHKQGLEWPDAIEIITTSVGKEQAKLNLLTDGKLKALCDEYQLPVPVFDENSIKVIPDANGKGVADARTLEDQEALADFIVNEVAKHTKDNNTQIHASIAGGRKTMTFFLGYAMSIFGREFDRLSHVLVSRQFESNPKFYFPTKEPKTISGRDNITLDCSQAEVMLAEIPIISQRMINPKMVNEFSHFTYKEIVNAIQLVHRPDQVRLVMVFNRDNPHIMFGSKEIAFKNRKADFAMLAAFARARKNNQAGFYRQSGRKNAQNFTHALLQELCQLENQKLDLDNIDQMLIKLSEISALDIKTADALIRSHDKEFDENGFSDKRNSLQKFLNGSLPKAAVNLLVPQTNGQNNPYQIQIPADNISFKQE